MTTYFGDVELARSCPLGEIVLAHHRSRARLDAHNHENSYLSVCVDGAYLEEFEGGFDEVRRGDLFVHPQQEGHSNDMGAGGATILNLQVSESIQRLYGVQSSHGTRLKIRCSERALGQLESLLAPEARASKACEFLTAAEILLPELVTNSASRPVRDPHLQTAAEAAKAEPEAPWTLADLASFSGYHRIYFAQKFKTEFGCPPGEYVRRLRLRHSLRLMCIEGVSATAAAHGSGFYDSAHMANTFRRVTGATPSELRHALADSH